MGPWEKGSMRRSEDNLRIWTRVEEFWFHKDKDSSSHSGSLFVDRGDCGNRRAKQK